MDTLKSKEAVTRAGPGTKNVVNSNKVRPETDSFTDRFRNAFIRKAKNDVTRYVIDQYFEGLKSGAEPESIIALFSEDVDFDIPAHEKRALWMEPGSGRTGVADFIYNLHEETASIDFEVGSILVDGAEAVALGVMESRAGNTEEVIKSEFAMNFTVHNARITCFRLFENSLAITAQVVRNQELVSSYY